MKRPGSIRIVAIILILAMVVAFALRPARGSAPIALGDMPVDARLSVMTYNVEGLPFPVRLGRGTALAAIGERLRDLRAAGRQPRIVVLQEAFSDDARQLGKLGGYRYIASGPSQAVDGGQPSTTADRAFAAEASGLKGEAQGKWLDSGLRILSDYPIVAVRRMAFPAYACAGYDCLANKGAVMALVRVPGMATPVAVVDTHLNSRHAAKVSNERTLYAYRRQVDALSAFLKANYVSGVPLIVAGDFNIGKDKDRAAYIEKASALWWNRAGDAVMPDALGRCRDSADCAARLSGDARYSIRRHRDMQFLAEGRDVVFDTRQIATPFGHEADGTMLSDHVGYVAYYKALPRAARRS